MLSLIFGLSDLTLSEDFKVRGYTSWVFVTRELISAVKTIDLVVTGLSSGSGEED